jgi:hypothetical protein
MIEDILQTMILLDIWSDITDPIMNQMIMPIFGSELLVGVFFFIIILIFTFIFGLGILVGIVPLIPAMFIVFGFIPSGRIILALILGFMVGIGLNRLIRR